MIPIFRFLMQCIATVLWALSALFAAIIIVLLCNKHVSNTLDACISDMIKSIWYDG